MSEKKPAFKAGDRVLFIGPSLFGRSWTGTVARPPIFRTKPGPRRAQESRVLVDTGRMHPRTGKPRLRPVRSEHLEILS